MGGRSAIRETSDSSRVCAVPHRALGGGADERCVLRERTEAIVRASRESRVAPRTLAAENDHSAWNDAHDRNRAECLLLAIDDLRVVLCALIPSTSFSPQPPRDDATTSSILSATISSHTSHAGDSYDEGSSRRRHDSLRNKEASRRLQAGDPWTITSDMNVISPHMIVDEGATNADVVDALCRCLSTQLDIEHSSFQLETRDPQQLESDSARR